MPSRHQSGDPHNDLNVQMDHYIGIDVGTGSARACIVDKNGDIVGLAAENIGLWQPKQGYYVRLEHFHFHPILDLSAHLRLWH